MRRTTAAVAAGALGLAALGGVGVGSALMTAASAQETPSETATPSPTDIPSTGTDDDTTDSTDDDADADDDDSAAERLASRVSRISEALAGLVGAGTIDQEQADAVAETLAESDALRGGGHGGGGGFGVLREGLETAATTLGVTEDELRTQLQAGSTLGEFADEAGVERSTLVDALVTVAETQLAERVASGDITQERADEITAELETKVTESLDRELGGRGGFGRGGRDDDTDDGTTDDGTDTSTENSSTTGDA